MTNALSEGAIVVIELIGSESQQKWSRILGLGGLLKT